jgi:N-glycosylase/DNA lyase
VTGLVEVAAPDFDLALSLNCGQVFHWREHDAGWIGAIGDEPCYAEQRGGSLLIGGVAAAKAQRYFALDHSVAGIHASFPRDPAMDAAASACRGLRIIRQPWWECVATFITSAQKAVPHIAQISHTLRTRYGRCVEWSGQTLFAYPEPAALAALDESHLRACALGYRAKNLLRSAQLVATGEVDLAHIASLDDASAHRALMRLAGVGPKVANCALLFAYERLAAVPIDVWIERVLREIYFAGKRRVTARRLRSFAETYFGPFGGYAQQYLFHHARTSRRMRGA